MGLLRITLICAFLVTMFAKGNSDSESIIDAKLNAMEAAVTEIANKSHFNDLNCSLVRTCDTSCTRWACSSFDSKDSTECLEVPQNSTCGRTCGGLRLSMSRSDVRLPVRAPLTNVINSSICTQRPLDIVFQKLYNKSNDLTLWLYFGSASGVQRSYPGKEYANDNCSQYDPRKRPWYIAATAVIKDLHILLDVSSHMNETDISGEEGIETAKNIIMELAETFSPYDRIHLSLYNESNHVSHQQWDIDHDETNRNKTIERLRDTVKQIQTNAFSNYFVTDNALSWAIKNFTDSTIKLKIIIVFSSQNPIATLNETTKGNITKDIISQSIKTFIYRVGDSTKSSTLSSFVYNINGSYMGTSSNHLWSIRSYFSYIARLRFKTVNEGAAWTHAYDDFNGMGKVISTYYPAFDANNNLIGVAGIDLIMTKAELIEEAKIKIRLRNGSNSTPIAGNLEHGSQEDDEVASCSIPSSTVLCQSRTRTNSSMCCAECNDHKKMNKKIIIGSTIGGGLLILIIISIIVKWKITKRITIRNDKNQQIDKPIWEPVQSSGL